MAQPSITMRKHIKILQGRSTFVGTQIIKNIRLQRSISRIERMMRERPYFAIDSTGNTEGVGSSGKKAGNPLITTESCRLGHTRNTEKEKSWKLRLQRLKVDIRPVICNRKQSVYWNATAIPLNHAASRPLCRPPGLFLGLLA